MAKKTDKPTKKSNAKRPPVSTVASISGSMKYDKDITENHKPAKVENDYISDVKALITSGHASFILLLIATFVSVFTAVIDFPDFGTLLTSVFLVVVTGSFASEINRLEKKIKK